MPKAEPTEVGEGQYIGIPFEQPRAKEIKYADLGPSRKYDPSKDVDGEQPVNEEEYESALEEERKNF